MKREILFRGKRVDNNEWVYGIVHHNLAYILNSKYLNEYEDWIKVIPETVGQFTGVKIKDEKVFEGDILKRGRESKPTFIALIEFKHGVFGGTTLPHKNHFIEMPRLPRCDYDGTGYDEIIGNVHDNPELLNSASIAV